MSHPRTMRLAAFSLFQFLFLSLAPVASLHAGPLAPPVSPPSNVIDSYAGVPVDDPYRHLEKIDSPDTRAWAAGQGQFAREALDRIPGLPALRQRIEELDRASSDRITELQRIRGGQMFYLKRRPQDPAPKLYTRSAAGIEKLVFEAESLKGASGKNHSINSYSVSPDGRHVAMVIAQQDAELGAIHILELASGKMVGARIERIWGELEPVWLPGGKEFLFVRSGDPALAYGKNQMFLRRVDGEAKDERPFIGYQIDSTFKSRDNDWLIVSTPASSPYVVLRAIDGLRSPARLFFMKRSEFGKPGAAWQSLAGEDDKARSFGHAGKWLYTRNYDTASRYRIMRRDLSRPDLPAVEVVPQQRGVIEHLGVAKDGIYYVVRTGAVGELFMLAHGAPVAKARKVSMPWQGTIALANTDPEVDGVVFTLEPWTMPMHMMSASLARPAPRDAGLIAQRGQGHDDVEAIETTCTARDGARVPISILMKKGLARDGGNSTILIGYAGYGRTETASFQPSRGAFLERGGILAIANPRGSGAYGEDWYRAGRAETKPNTWRDMIDCADMLVRERYTSPAKLGIRGGSMGGVLAGRALTERPDLFATALIQVGLLDAMRMMAVSQNGPNHVSEMGDAKTEAGARALLAMSSYHHVKDGTRYPAVILTTGMNDNRVDPWMSFKMAARLQAANAGDKPILLRIDEQGGHGVSSTAAQRNSLAADLFAFHLWQTGDPAFQPK